VLLYCIVVCISQTSDYLHYSDCECAIGDRRQALCYRYTVGKHAGWGILSVFLGILTSCLIYFVVFYVIDKLRNMSCQNKEGSKSEKPDENDTRSAGSEVETVTDTPKVEPFKELTSPTKRHHNCWACDVKYNNAQPPVFYSRDNRQYQKTK